MISLGLDPAVPMGDYREALSLVYRTRKKWGKPLERERRARVTWAHTIPPKLPDWLWTIKGRGRIPKGSLVLVAGREGTGKSSFGIWLAAQLTKGNLSGCLKGERRRILYVAVEDSWQYTLVPRLMAAGANLKMAGRFEVVEQEDDEVILSLPHDNKLLEDEIIRTKAAMVVVDPLLSMIGDKIDTHGARDVRKALDPLAKIADRTGAVILGIAHFNKGSSTDVGDLISGSHAFRDVPRAIFGFVRNDEEGTRVMTQVKNSLGRDDDLPSLTYEIRSTQVSIEGRWGEVGKFAWTGISAKSVLELLQEKGKPPKAPEDHTEHEEAEAWLEAYMEGKEFVPAKEGLKASREAGISKSTLARARAKLGIQSHQVADGWVWSYKEKD
jgi:hypothetical protein